MIKFIWALSSVLIVLLQVRLWSDEGGVPQIYEINQLIEEQEAKNETLRLRNAQMHAQIALLANGPRAIEELARENMGLIKQGETFFLVIEEKEKD